MDFAPSDTNEWVAASGDGVVSGACGYCDAIVGHAGGWSTRYYHLQNRVIPVGQAVTRDDHLSHPGTSTCCGGSATGVHVHFCLMYNGAYTAIAGTSFEGWVVHAGANPYGGYLKNGTAVVNQWGYLTSDATAPTTEISLVGTVGENGWYISPVQIS